MLARTARNFATSASLVPALMCGVTTTFGSEESGWVTSGGHATESLDHAGYGTLVTAANCYG